mmetsp:Transcript_150371/g.481232  ORF Transcript_150371/g.481232 Transcript_150371/m.481232 type:complete len:897 (+) Transcript_150371:46-2736(+)
MAGWFHSVLLRSDGRAIAFGRSDCRDRKYEFIPEGDGRQYIAAAAGLYHTVLLTSDGQLEAVGCNGVGQCSVPDLPCGIRYVNIAASEYHTAAIRSDGRGVAFGNNFWGQCDVPALPEGLRFVAVAAGMRHTIFLRSDGLACACGQQDDGRCEVPAAPEGRRYVAAAAGGRHTLLLMDDGQAATCGGNLDGETSVPPLPGGLAYVAAAAGGNHSVLLRSDGRAVAFGANAHGQCNAPELPEGLRYVHIAAGYRHTLLLRSDGCAFAVGWSLDGQCDVPELPAGARYIPAASDLLLPSGAALPLQATPRASLGAPASAPGAAGEAASPSPVAAAAVGSPWSQAEPQPLPPASSPGKARQDEGQEEEATPSTLTPNSPGRDSSPGAGSAGTQQSPSASWEWYRGASLEPCAAQPLQARGLVRQSSRDRLSGQFGVFSPERVPYGRDGERGELGGVAFQGLNQGPAAPLFSPPFPGRPPDSHDWERQCRRSGAQARSPARSSSRGPPGGHGHTFFRSNSREKVPTDFLREPGGFVVPDLREMTRPGLSQGCTFLSSAPTGSPHERPHDQLQEYGGHIRDLGDVTRRGLSTGRTRMSSSGEALGGAPHDQLHEYGGYIRDLGDVTRPGLQHGGTYMSSAGEALGGFPHDQLQESGGRIRDLSDVTRPGLNRGYTCMLSAGEPLSGCPHDQLHEYGGLVRDLSEVTRPRLRQGQTFMPSAPPQLSPLDQLHEYGGRVENLGNILRTNLRHDVGSPFHSPALLTGGGVVGGGGGGGGALPSQVLGGASRSESCPRQVGPWPGEDVPRHAPCTPRGAGGASPRPRSPSLGRRRQARPRSADGWSHGRQAPYKHKVLTWARRYHILQNAIREHVSRWQDGDGMHQARILPDQPADGADLEPGAM